MRRFWPLLLLSIILLVAIMAQQARGPEKQVRSAAPQRIISLAPSLTEIAFELGLENKIKGVTRYCNYPPAAKSLPRIGSFLDPNFDAIVQHQPDLVLLLDNTPRISQQLQQLGIPTLAVNNETLSNIDHAIDQIGDATSTQQQATTLRQSIQQAISQIQQKVAKQNKPSVLLIISRDSDEGALSNRYIAGHHDFYQSLIQLAGGINAYPYTRTAIPSLSAEGILQLNPDIIIELFPAADEHPFDLQKIQQQWQQLNNISPLTAIHNNQLHMIEADYTTIPGPRLPLLLKNIAQLIHPGLNWEDS